MHHTKNVWEKCFYRIVIPSEAEGSLLLSSSSPALLNRLHETPHPTFMEYQASRFRSHAHRSFHRERKRFLAALEMTVRESNILALLSSPRRKALVRGHGSPSFLWKEVPRRGGGWLTQRNKKEWVRSIFPYRHPERSRGIFVAILFLTSSAEPFA